MACANILNLINLTFKYGNDKILKKRGIDMNNVTDYINEFEEKLIEREKSLTAANKDFKDVNDLTS